VPFVTEELWQRVPKPASRKASVALGPYPRPQDEKAHGSAEVEAQMGLLQEIISAARTVRSEHGVEWKHDVPVSIRTDVAEIAALVREQLGAVRLLVKTRGEPLVEGRGGAREAGTTVSVVTHAKGTVEVLVGLKGLVEKDAELGRIDREAKKVDKDLAALDKKLGSPGFVDRAPPEVVAEAHTQRQGLLDAKKRLEEARILAGEL
jgi:valyl-tRNA synthetase